MPILWPLNQFAQNFNSNSETNTDKTESQLNMWWQ